MPLSATPPDTPPPRYSSLALLPRMISENDKPASVDVDKSPGSKDAINKTLGSSLKQSRTRSLSDTDEEDPAPLKKTKPTDSVNTETIKAEETLGLPSVDTARGDPLQSATISVTNSRHVAFQIDNQLAVASFPLHKSTNKPQIDSELLDEARLSPCRTPSTSDFATISKSTHLSAPGPSQTSSHSGPIPIVPSRPKLSPMQAKILRRALGGHSVFFTGSAGTGKSVLLRAIIAEFQNLYAIDETSEVTYEGSKGRRGYGQSERAIAGLKVGVTASTGIAAGNIGGMTIHSWASIKTGVEPVDVYIKSIRGNTSAKRRWQFAEVLIIDEISMIDARLFTKLDQIARAIRVDDRPFGGIKLIISGDFFQLAPVSRESQGEPPALFAFEAPVWAKVFHQGNMFNLTAVYRQRDEAFIRVLEDMRRGRVTRHGIDLLKGLSRPVTYNDGQEPIRLFPLKQDVDALNASRLTRLPGSSHKFYAVDVPGQDEFGDRVPMVQARKMLDDYTSVRSEIILKKGAMVMLLQVSKDGLNADLLNMPSHNLVNGSCGTVVDFLKLPEAISKRIDSVGGISSDDLCPVVEFSADAIRRLGTRRLLVPPVDKELVNWDGTIRATRKQIPLALAWGMTIHKVQGQTLSRVVVDCRHMFAAGQTYVAVSRVVSLDCLELRDFEPSKIKINPRVVAWARRVGLDEHETE